MAKKYQRQWEYSLEQTKQYVEHPKAPADGSAPAWKVSSRGNPDHFALSMDFEDGKRAVPTLGAEIPTPTD